MSGPQRRRWLEGGGDLSNYLAHEKRRLRPNSGRQQLFFMNRKARQMAIACFIVSHRPPAPPAAA